MTAADPANDSDACRTVSASETRIRVLDLVRTLALGVAAGLVNLHAPTVFLDSQIMLGGTLVVYALLRHGWLGLLTGALALGATALRWGHPFELIIGLLFFTWLMIFLKRMNGGWEQRDNGRVLQAAALFWLVAGIPLELFLFNRHFDLPVSEAVGIGLKEGVTGLFNTTLGLLVFLILRWRTAGGRPGVFSVRGLTFAVIHAAIVIPGLGLTVVVSHQLKNAVLNQHFLGLRSHGERAADLADLGEMEALDAFARADAEKHFLLRRADGTVIYSDASLFDRLQRDYEIETPARTGRSEIGIFRPRQNASVIRNDINSYWLAKFDRPVSESVNRVASVRVVQTSGNMVSLFDYPLSLPSFSVLLVILLGGTAAASWVARGTDRQIRRVLSGATASPESAALRLNTTPVRELNKLVEAINELEDARGRALDAARASREQLQLTLEHLPIAIAIYRLDKPGHLLYLNRQFIRTLGYTLEEIPTLDEWARLAYPDAAYRCQAFVEWDAAVARAVEDRGTVESMEFEVMAKDGSCRRIVFHAVVMEDRLLVSLTDITARRRTEAELQAAREELRRVAYELTENIPVGTYTMVQPPGGGMACFSFLSSRFLELTGLTRERAQENPLNAFACVHPEDYDEWVRKNMRSFEHKLPFHESCRVVVQGVTRWVTAESSPRDLPDGSVVWEGVLTDITARKTAEQELVAARQREQEIERGMRETLKRKLKTSLHAAAIAHEINQPLSRILLRTRIELDKDDAPDKDSLRALAEDAECVVGTIEKMRVLLRNVETVQQPVDLAQVVRSTLFQLKQSLRLARVEVAPDARDQHCIVLGDDVQLQMVVTNLVRNAIEAIAGSDSPRREIAIEWRYHDDIAELIIGDSGPGWPGGTIDEMLLRTTKREGSGIGLYVVKTALENHRARMTIGCSPLGGAEFRLVFPKHAAG